MYSFRHIDALYAHCGKQRKCEWIGMHVWSSATAATHMHVQLFGFEVARCRSKYLYQVLFTFLNRHPLSPDPRAPTPHASRACSFPYSTCPHLKPKNSSRSMTACTESQLTTTIRYRRWDDRWQEEAGEERYKR